MSTEIETVWYRHRENGSLHEAEKGSEAHRRLQSERTVVDEGAGEVPESVFERVSAGEVKKAADNPEKQPGFHQPVKRGPRRGQVVVEVAAGESSGPSEDEINDRIAKAAADAAAAAIAKFTEDLAQLAPADPSTEPAETPATAPKNTKPEPKKD